MKKITLFILIAGILMSCQQTSKKSSIENENKFSFVFMTDIHLTTERNATEGLLQAIDTINSLAPEFVLTGGDNIMDALGQTYGHSDSLYNLWEETIKNLNMPIYHTMGNHEIFGLYEESGVSPTHEEYGKKMYENRLAKRYYSFDYKNWHFIIIDGIGFTDDRHYFGKVDSVQIEWLKQDLQNTGTEKPIAISTHIPLLTIQNQILYGPSEGISPGSVITNNVEIIKILQQYNVKLVLQGHLHFLEDIYHNGTHYITGGAVSSKWWQGKRMGMEEGFLKIDISGEEFEWEYIDYGWEVEEE